MKTSWMKWEKRLLCTIQIMMVKLKILKKKKSKSYQKYWIYSKKLKGTVSIEELKMIIEKCDINLTDDQFNDMVDSLDKNSDDKIEFEGNI